jgi:hypothetical protein
VNRNSLLVYVFTIFAFNAGQSFAACPADLGIIWPGSDSKIIKLTRSKKDLLPPRVFDSNIAKFPVGYSGLDPYLVWEVLNKSQREKSEYESTAQYNDRRQLDTPYALKYGYNTSHQIPIVMDVDLYMNFRVVSLEYDADKRILNITVGKVEPYSKNFEITVQENTQSRVYVGTTAFGVQKEITDYTGCHAVIVSPQRKPVVISIPSTPEEAKKLKSSKLSLVVVFKPIPPYVMPVDWISTKATLDKPSSLLISKYRLYGNIEGLYIFDKKSGRILGKSFIDQNNSETNLYEFHKKIFPNGVY